MLYTKQIIFFEMNITGLLKGLFLKLFGGNIYYHGVSSVVLRILLKSPISGKILNRLVKKYGPPKYISEYEGSFFLIENLTVELTSSFFSDRSIAERKGVKIYKEHYETKRIDTVIKFYVQDKIRNFLRFYYQARHSNNDLSIIFPENEVYRYVLEKKPFDNLKPLKTVFAGMRTFSALHGFLLLIVSMINNAMIILKRKYSFQNLVKRKYRVCIRGHFPKSEGLLRNDFLINEGEIDTNEVLFFIENGESAHGKELKDYYRQKSHHYTVLDDLKTPIRALPGMISDYILLPLRAFLFYLFTKEWTSFNALLFFSRTALKSKYERIFLYFDIRLMLLFHSAGAEMLIASVLCGRNKTKLGIYNFGSTVSWGRWAPYAFQATDYYFTWGGKIVDLYIPTCEFEEVVKTGFWGKGEYSTIYTRRDELKRKIIGSCPGNRIITFYDIPYFHERSTFTARHLLDFYHAAVACSKIENIIVILKMKSTYNISGATYPPEIKPLFDALWQNIKKCDNMIILDTSMYDPLHIIAISDVNVTLELSSPSTIALICGEAGIFYNAVFDYANHSLYPKYFGRIIFDDAAQLVDTIKKHLSGGTNLRNIVDSADLNGYDECRDSLGLERLRQAVLERTN